MADLYGPSGYSQLKAAAKRNREDADVIANPVGPPAPVPAPAPASAAATISRPTPVTVDPSPTLLAQQGVLRPPTGPWSASNPQPMADGTGRLIPPRPVAAAQPGISPAAQTAAPTSGPAGQVGTALAAAAPAITRPTFGSVTGGAATTRPQATSINGRPLGYGATVDGVRVFSDGSGGQNSPAATITRPQFDTLAQGRSLTRADAGIGGAIGTMAAGGTPELGAFTGRTDGISIARPVPDAYARARADNIEAQRMAASDAASIATQDTRSVLGRAARAAAIDANSSFGTPAARRAQYTAALNSLGGAATGGMEAQARLGDVGVQDAGATSREQIQSATSRANNALNARTELSRALITRPTPTQVNLANGTLGLLGPDGIIRPAIDSTTGAAARPEQTRKQLDQGAYSKMVNERVNQLLQIDPLTGKRPNGQAPTPEELSGAQSAAIALTDQAFGGTRGDGGAPAPSVGPPAEATEFLRQNPQYRDQFDKKYGAGASARVLGAGA